MMIPKSKPNTTNNRKMHIAIMNTIFRAMFISFSKRKTKKSEEMKTSIF